MMAGTVLPAFVFPTAACGHEVDAMKNILVILALVGILLLGCVSCGTPESSTSPEPSLSAEVTAVPTSSSSPALEPTPTPEPTSIPEPIPPDITLGYWEANSYRLSDGLIYQFKDDGTYKSWFMNGAFSPAGRYTYENWILSIQDNDGQEIDWLYYALETGQFISTMTEHIITPEYTDNNGAFIPIQSEPTTLTYHDEPTIPDPYKGVTPSTIFIDLSDPAMYRKLNIFLSNFSECNFSSFSVENPNYGEIADFAFMHAWINSPSVVEDYSKYFPVHNDYDYVTSCVSVSYIEKVAKHFFAGEIDTASIEAAWKSGHGSGVITNGAYGTGFTLADSVTDLGQNRFEVQFHTYTVPYSDAPTYDYSSTSDVYSAHPDDLPQALYGQGQFVGTPGSAVIETIKKEDGSLTFLLETYTVEQ